MNKLGLFPLGAVLFPGSELPIHVFEPRYRKLIVQSVQDSTPFGINQISTDKFYEIGCSVQVAKVLHTYEDGKIDLIVRGLKRYIVRDIIESDNSFWVGVVDYLEDIPELVDVLILTKCISLYNEIASTIKSIDIPKLDPDSLSTPVPSYHIAQKAGLNHKDKQTILEMRSENKRLHFLYNHLKEVVPLLKEAEYLNQIIKNDGYYNPERFFNL